MHRLRSNDVFAGDSFPRAAMRREEAVTWSRSHDALIARVAEGLEVTWIECWGPSGRDPHVEAKDKRDWMDRVADYPSDLPAAIRAAEAWRKQGERWYSIEAPSRTCNPEYFHASLYSVGNKPVIITAGTIAEALAWALWLACGGVE